MTFFLTRHLKRLSHLVFPLLFNLLTTVCKATPAVSHTLVYLVSGVFPLCCCSVSKSFSTLCDSTHSSKQASLSFTISWSLLKLMSIASVIPYNHLILCCPLLLLPSVFPSIRVFSNESALRMRWPKFPFILSLCIISRATIALLLE